jgi:hypothetical protein
MRILTLRKTNSTIHHPLNCPEINIGVRPLAGFKETPFIDPYPAFGSDKRRFGYSFSLKQGPRMLRNGLVHGLTGLEGKELGECGLTPV